MRTLMAITQRGKAWTNSTAPWFVWVILAVTWVFFAAVTLATRTQFTPDSRYYYAMTYRILGYSEVDAQAKLALLTVPAGGGVLPLEQLFHWGLVQPRVLYPTLSAPFVAVFGTQGMVAVPIIAMAFVTFGAFAYIARRYGLTAGLVPVVLVTMSTYLMLFGTAMLTESLAAALVLGMVFALPLRRSRGRGSLVALGVLTVALAFTRQAWILPAAAVGLAWLGDSIGTRRLRNRWLASALVVGITGIACQVVQSVLWPSFSILDQLRKAAGVDSLFEAILRLPRMARHIFGSDMREFSFHDRPLLVLLAAAVVAAVMLWRRPEAHLYVGGLLGGALLNVVNGSNTQFRYEMPALAFVMVVVGAGVSVLVARARSWRAAQGGKDGARTA